MSERHRPLAAVLAGTLACLVAQGLGRFILTPLLPAMQASAGLGDAAAGLLASANFAGYLAGALAVLLLPGGGRHGAATVGLALVLAGSVVMAGATVLWLAGRAAAGFGGALLFLAGTAWAAGELERAGRSGLVGLVFAGVGVGILAGGALALAVLPDWRAAWLWGRPAAGRGLSRRARR